MTKKQLDGAAIDRLFSTIKERRHDDPMDSYTAQLFALGSAKIAKKVGEEAIETVIASASGATQEVIKESADLLYHLLVLWAEMGVCPVDIYAELAKREGLSGIEEKKYRGLGEQ